MSLNLSQAVLVAVHTTSASAAPLPPVDRRVVLRAVDEIRESVSPCIVRRSLFG